jgi:ubiquitin thioesterase OTU1
MKLRFRLPGASAPKEMVFEEGTAFGMLPFLLEEDLNVAAPFIAILSGVPPKPVVAEPDVPLEKLFKEGEMLVVSKRAGQTEDKIIRGVTNGRYVPPSDKHGVFIVRTVPSDNSCLFHACSYVLEDKNRTGGPSLRLRVAEVVQLNPEKFCFGEGQDYTTEAYVVYTGTHYDAMAVTHPVAGVVTGSGGPESEDPVLFNPRDGSTSGKRFFF